MSGHSHWATIKRAKGAADAKKGKIFSKLGKEITIVVKAKGGDPNTNPTLRTLIAKAKAAQMPNDNIERAIKKGTGELESAALVDAQYEGIKGGVAFVVNVLTDNKNRAAAEVGNVFKKNGLEFAKQGSATRLFDRLGQIMIPAADGITEDKVMEVALEAGAEDVLAEDGGFTVKCQQGDFTTVLEAIKAAGIAVDEENSSIGLVPNMTTPVSDVATAKSMQKFIDMLEDLEDVQDVYNNMETTDEVDAALEAEG
ncbi:MAG: YebC/PmpR family DNA-binding transcriptional regulator [Kiritimatiellae bacterium]|nr:YebC/PmpR family DNA-binding transcriptional regulator [Kiritimatiellia bacterium]